MPAYILKRSDSDVQQTTGDLWIDKLRDAEIAIVPAALLPSYPVGTLDNGDVFFITV